MTRYAVGDLQGCLKPLQCLLDEVNFDQRQDQLWLAGDLINRGPDSLKTLRFVKSLGDCAHIVLGNHDLHFLAVAHGAKKARKSDTFKAILKAEDRDELVTWLQQQPLMYTDPSGDYSMVHAGIPPIWSLTQAKKYAQEVETVLRSNKAIDYFQTMYGNDPNCWQEELTGSARLRTITNYFTRMRFCTSSGELDFDSKLTQCDKTNYAPWFSYHDRAIRNDKIIFGHWAALKGKTKTQNIYALDTGCVWGEKMTLMNLDTEEFYYCSCSNKTK
jgi:bis(5'-nucleosyl)-tetraphosphatase (symmetrical)